MEEIQFKSLSEENLIEKIKEIYYLEKKLVLIDLKRNETIFIEKKHLPKILPNYAREVFIETKNESQYKILNLENSMLFNVERVNGNTEVFNVPIVYIPVTENHNKL